MDATQNTEPKATKETEPRQSEPRPVFDIVSEVIANIKAKEKGKE